MEYSTLVQHSISTKLQDHSTYNLWYSSSTLYQLSYKTIQLTTFDTVVQHSISTELQHHSTYNLWYCSSTLYYQLSYKTIQLTTFDTPVQHSINWVTKPSNLQPLILQFNTLSADIWRFNKSFRHFYPAIKILSKLCKPDLKCSKSFLFPTKAITTSFVFFCSWMAEMICNAELKLVRSVIE